MALPAGRYGVTKNQLLKIKKLPMNTIKLIEEIQEELDTLVDTVGWVASKNLLDPSIISNGVQVYTPIYVGDGDFTLSSNVPQASGSLAVLFLLAGNVRTGASTDINGVWNGQSRTVTAVNGYVTVSSRLEGGVSAVGYNNQLEKGSTATSYEPYHASVENTLRDAEVIEGKNKLQNIAVSSGIFTVNNDGTVTVDTGGTLAAQQIFVISAPYTTTESMILNGTPSDGRDTTFAIFATDTGGLYYWDNYGEGVTIPSGKTITVYIVVRASQSLTNKVFKPMLRKATETDPTYEPYYIPLKDVVPNKCDNSVIGTVEDGTNPTKAYAVGEHFIRYGKFCTCTVAVTTSSTWTEGSNYVEGTIADNLIKQEAFNVTTNAAGVANLCNNDRIVVAIKSAGHIVQSYVTASGTSINIKSYDYQGNLDANVNITGTYYYI